MEEIKKEKPESVIFSKVDLDSISEKIDINMENLMLYTDYESIEYKLIDLELKLPNYFDEKQMKIIDKYSNLLRENAKLQNALAYYLGMKAMKEIDKLK